MSSKFLTSSLLVIALSLCLYWIDNPSLKLAQAVPQQGNSVDFNTPSSSHQGQCQPNLILDDFQNEKMDFIDGANRHVGLTGGDYGGKGIETSYYHLGPKSLRHLTLFVNQDENHFFFKINKESCSDIHRYKSVKIKFHVSLPYHDSNSAPSADFTLTQKSKDCKTRPSGSLSDSNYNAITDYVSIRHDHMFHDVNTFDEDQIQTVELPLKDFAGRAHTHVFNEPFDFHHLKDFTLVQLRPVHSFWRIFHIELIGNCDHSGHHESSHGQSGSHHGSSSSSSSNEHHSGNQESNESTTDSPNENSSVEPSTTEVDEPKESQHPVIDPPSEENGPKKNSSSQFTAFNSAILIFNVTFIYFIIIFL